MQKDLVFFKKEGEEGVALTSTSANHIANMAKEYIQGMETQLNNVSFLNVEVGLISANAHNVIQEGTSREVLSLIPSMLESIAQAKSLIAWLREAIKAKNDLIDGLQSVSLDDWCEECGETTVTCGSSCTDRAGVLCFSSYKGEEQILPA